VPLLLNQQYNYNSSSLYVSNTNGVDCNAMTYNCIGYYTSNGPTGLGEQSTDGILYSQAHNTQWVGQIAQDYRNGRLFVRSKNNGTWQPWKRVALLGNSEVPPYMYHEGFAASNGTTKTITGLTECRCYLVTWAPLYAAGASRGAWLVFMSTVANQRYIHTITSIGCSLTVGANSVTFTYQYSGGGDIGCLSCIEL
jgi:hypothetical protein